MTVVFFFNIWSVNKLNKYNNSIFYNEVNFFKTLVIKRTKK